MDKIYNDIELLIDMVREAEGQASKADDMLFLYSSRKFLTSAHNEIEKVSPDFGEAK